MAYQNSKIRVSIIIASYNRPIFLGECLESLFAQLYPSEFEIIVVNDGSKDDYSKIIKGYPAVKYFRKRHGGVGSARRFGVEKANGEIIAFIDDDAVADRGWLRNLVNALGDKKIAGVGGRIKGFDRKGVVEKFGEDKLFDVRDNIKGTYQPPFLTTCNCAYRKEAIEKVDSFRDSLNVGEDLDLGWRLSFSQYRFVYAPKALVYHRMPNSFLDLCGKMWAYGKAKALITKKYKAELKKYDLPQSFRKFLTSQVVAFFKLFGELSYSVRSMNPTKDRKYLMLKPIITFLTQAIFELSFLIHSVVN